MTRHPTTLADKAAGRLGPQPQRLPAAMPDEAERYVTATTTTAITVANLPGFREATIPAGTHVEVVGYSERSGFPRIRYGAIQAAIVDPDSIRIDP